MRQFDGMRAVAQLGFLVILGACSMGVRTAAPPALPQGQSSPFSTTLDYLREEFRDEPIPMTVRVLVGSVGHYAPRRIGLDAHIINVSQTEADEIRAILRGEGLAEARTLEWGDCPSFKTMEPDRSGCPDSSYAVLAIGTAEKTVISPADQQVLGRALDESEFIIPTMVTFIGPWGAHTRFQSLLLRRSTTGWTVVRALSNRYVE
jgi:hypothetical protein